MLFTPFIIEISALALSIVIYLGSLHVMRQRVRRNPMYAIQGVATQARGDWVASVMKEHNGILGVQTLRNSSTVASFMASTSTLLALGVLSLLQIEGLSSIWHSLSLMDKVPDSVQLFKVLVLMFDLFVAFFCFASSIRLYNHVGFMISTSVPEDELQDKICFVSALLNRAARHFHMGMLAFYFMVPLVFWIFGAVLLVVGTAGMTLIVRALDKNVTDPVCEAW